MTTEEKISSYYNEIVLITNDYLGPASERFINRQISFVLQKAPEQLAKEDILKLSERIRGALSLLTPDKVTVDEAVSRIASVAK